MAVRTNATVDDVLRLASQGERYELVDGELVAMAPTGFEHGDIEWQVGFVLGTYVREQQLGKVVVGEVLFQLGTSGGLGRAADVAFVRQERLPSHNDRAGVFHGAPDLAVEVVSPSESAESIQHKILDWLEHGTQIVVVVYPTTRRIALWNRMGGSLFHDEEELSLAPVLPGFRCRASDLFPPARENQD